MEFCALCAQAKILEDSHHLPKFFARILRKYTVNGRLFHPDDKGQQDVYHKHRLCGECEDRLSVIETAAAPRIREALQTSPPVANFDFISFARRLAFLTTLATTDDVPAFAEDQGIRDAVESWQQHLLGLAHHWADRHYALRLVPCTSELSDGIPVTVRNWSGIDAGILSGTHEVAFTRLHDLLFLSPMTDASFPELVGMECGLVDAFVPTPPLSGSLEAELWDRMVAGIHYVLRSQNLPT